jgi:hypothetical protein
MSAKLVVFKSTKYEYLVLLISDKYLASMWHKICCNFVQAQKSKQVVFFPFAIRFSYLLPKINK